MRRRPPRTTRTATPRPYAAPGLPRLAEVDAQGPNHVETTDDRQENLTELAARTPVHPPNDLTRDRRGKRSTEHVDDIDIGDRKGGVLRGFCNPGCLAGTRKPCDDAERLISQPDRKRVV